MVSHSLQEQGQLRLIGFVGSGSWGTLLAGARAVDGIEYLAEVPVVVAASLWEGAQGTGLGFRG